VSVDECGVRRGDTEGDAPILVLQIGTAAEQDGDPQEED
jgi:hypothetical protein